MSEVSLLYFASLREHLGIDQETLVIDDHITTMADVRTLLQGRGQPWSSLFSDEQRLMMSVNQAMAKSHSAIKAGDEIAFFPPVTGG